MSDALTDISRDQRRGEHYDEFLDEVVAFLSGTSTAEKVANIAKRCDSIPRGYWRSKTDLYEITDSLLADLEAHGLQKWAWLLAQLQERNRYTAFNEALAIAPLRWRGQKLAVIDYQTFSKGLNEMLRDAMHAAGNGTRFGGNPAGYFQYAVFYDDDSTLRDMATSAVRIGTHCESWEYFGQRIFPTSHRLEYLKQREEMLRQPAI